ncbi:MAG TPA: hypothetical protein DHU63_02455 [Candidatus Marinimicrobia bacterium]|nr:hypothetical protein [Candidatus Neomarinimicrobiota bacterium]
MTRNQDLLRRCRHFPSGKDFKDGMKAGLAPLNQFSPESGEGQVGLRRKIFPTHRNEALR